MRGPGGYGATPVRPLTATGTDEFLRLPFPNSPAPLPPQQLTVPLVDSAHEC